GAAAGVPAPARRARGALVSRSPARRTGQRPVRGLARAASAPRRSGGCVKSRLRLFALIVFWALLLAGVIVQSDTRTLTATSFGEIPAGYRALYDVLAEAGLPGARSLDAPER